MAVISARLRISPVITPTEAPRGAPPTSAKIRIRYRESICSTDKDCIVHPTAPVMTEASKMIRQRISSFFRLNFFLRYVKIGIA
ncbi:hypothetical protein D3C73_1217540 [compost metagenome]